MKESVLLKNNNRLMSEYNYEKNIDINLDNLTLGTERKIWWKCEKGHEWEANVYNRYKGRNCPYCSNQKILRGYNDLATTNPELITDWNYEKNNPLTPYDVGKGSEKKVWWKCEKGHEWQQSINKRSKNSICPYCSNQKVLKGYNDLVTTNPELVKEWNYEKNYPLKPDEVVAGSGKKVWWKCEKGHEWQVNLYHRKKGNNCPYCGNQKLLRGYNDLATTNPKLAKEWNYAKNTFGPETVMEHTNKKVWWKCEKGHEWLQGANVRANGCGCPYCAGQKILVGYNDLATTNQRLAKEWNYEKNKFGPETVMEHTNKKVWWKCEKGHEWEADINSRGSGSNCPICSKELNHTAFGTW